MELTIKIILAVIFTLAILGKLTGKTKSTFENAGFSSKLMYAILVVEMVFTVGLFTKYELFSTVGMLTIIGGAVFTLSRQKVKPAKYTVTLITAFFLIALLVLGISKSS